MLPPINFFLEAILTKNRRDEPLGDFWEKHEPEDFGDWEEGSLDFRRPLKKLIQLRLDPGDVRIIDRESRLTGIDRAQLVRSWVKEKISLLEKRNLQKPESGF